MRGRTDDHPEWLGGRRPTGRYTAALAEVLDRGGAEHGTRLDRINTGLAGAVLVTIAAEVALRVINNQPGAMAPELAAVHGWLAAAVPSVVAALTVLVGVTRRDAPTRVGLVFAGVFGLLGLHVPAASLPAIVAVTAGAGLGLVDHVRGSGWTRPAMVAAVVWLGFGLSLASATGVLPGVRPEASTIALIGIALLPVAIRPPPWAWIAGAVAAGAVFWLGWVSPFVTGAVVLVAFGVVGSSTIVVAGAAGGGVAGLVGALSGVNPAGLSGRWPTAVAACLVLVTGVPATMPRALAAGVGIALLVGGETA